MSSFRALGEVIEVRGLFCSLYADRASHYWHTPEGRRQGGQEQPDPGGPSPGPAGHRTDPGLLPRGPGALGAHVRDIAESPAAGTALGRHHHDGRGQRVPARDLSAPPQRPFRGAGRSRGLGLCPLHRIARRHPVHPGGPDRRQRQHVRYKRLVLQIPEDRHRRHYVKASVRVHEYSGGTWRSSTARAGWPDIRPTAPSSTKPRTAERPREPLRRAPGPVDKWTTRHGGFPLPHRPNNHNRSGQFIWYIKRSIRNVLDTVPEPMAHHRKTKVNPLTTDVASPICRARRAAPPFTCWDNWGRRRPRESPR